MRWDRLIRHGRARLRRLRADRRAAVLPMMAMGLVTGLAAIGMGVDLSRLYLATTQLQVAADAAALAGGRSFSIDDNTAADRDTQAEAYFDANFPQGFLGSTNLSMNPLGAPARFQTINGVYVTTFSASAKLPMLFMQLFGFKPREIHARARAELQPRPLEVMVVLDNTGSESVNLPRDSAGVVKTRIQALKDGVKSFLEVLYQGGETRNDLALGFITYDITVNVGSLLTAAGGKITSLVGFNDPAFISAHGAWPTNRLAWKGCVMADSTVADLSDVPSDRPTAAYDVSRLLPGEGSNPAVQPFHFPPYWIPYKAVTAGNSDTPAVLITDGTSNYYKPGDNTRSNTTAAPTSANNLFQFSGLDYTTAFGAQMANTPVWRNYYYQFFIGLNNGADKASDDVIVLGDGTDGYYTPGAAVPWKVRYDRIPTSIQTASRPTADAVVNKDGGKTNDPSWTIYPTAHPSPNWQCPEAAMDVQYGRSKTTYRNYVDEKNGAIGPAAGTIHHAGLLWGYRLLVRDDKFLRSNPTSSPAKRAIVFMTDGESNMPGGGNGMPGYSWYGGSNRTLYNGQKIAVRSNQAAQSERRFAKVCDAIKSEANPPQVYIIALTTNDATALRLFHACAPGRVYETSDTKTLNDAFKAVATELVDLHLTQ